MWPSAVAAGLAVALSFTQLPSQIVLITCIVLYVSIGGHYTLWQIYATLPRDIKALVRFIRLHQKLRHAQKNNLSVPKLFQTVVAKHPDKIAFYFEDETWTFRQIDEYSNRIGNYFAKQGIKHGDAVALFMESRVEYVCIWLGICKIGAVPALINYNLRFDALKHCINVANCKAIISGAEIQAALNSILDDEKISTVPFYVSGAGKNELEIKGATNLDDALSTAATTVPPELEGVGFSDRMVFIYTSGTTGLPKAAVIKHSRFLFFSTGVHNLCGITNNEVIYDPLPLYHTAGGMLGTGQAMLFGCSTVIRAKFSATNYFKDCAKYNATAAQYIGEICRYLLNTPEKPEDKQHKVRIMFGNGLRPEIWKKFQERFNIPRINEFYGSTEGNANIINMEGKPGAVGFVSVLFPSVYPVALLKVDEETREIVRDSNGLCIRCKPGEAGEFIGKIVKNDPVRDFHGYADKKATEKKIARDVFRKGDYAFLSGDILVMDEEGYFYFKDRTGDTFRWKGENVATSEVEAVVSKATGHADVVVYGVEVPGADGRAGMAAILDANDELDFDILFKVLQKELAAYARPLFVRIVKHLEKTGTYKLVKVNLQKQGIDPKIITDKLYFLNAQEKKFVPLDEALYDKIVNGQVRV